jgi:hypothetical protein
VPIYSGDMALALEEVVLPMPEEGSTTTKAVPST